MGLFSSGSKKQRDKTRTFSDIQGADAKKYVQSHGDLLSAYNKMVANPAGTQGSYWIQRMGGEFSMAAFGEAHRGESKLLYEGKYAGGTKVKKADPEFFSKKATMRTDGDEIGMRNVVGPATVAEESTTESTTESTSTTSGENVNTTTGATDTTTTATNDALTTLSASITAITDQLATATATIERASLGIPYDAPAHIKTYEQYRAWLAEQSSASGFTSTVTSTMSATDYMANVKKNIMTALNALP